MVKQVTSWYLAVAEFLPMSVHRALQVCLLSILSGAMCGSLHIHRQTQSLKLSESHVGALAVRQYSYRFGDYNPELGILLPGANPWCNIEFMKVKKM